MSNSKNGKPRGFSYAIVAELILCMILINVFFLWWGLLQEDLTTKTFKVDDGQEDVDFDGYLFLNTLQSIGCVVVGIILIGLGTVLKCLYSCFATKSATSSSKTTPPSGVQVRKTFQYPRVMHHLLWIGFTQSIGPTFGMFAASYVSYPTVLVAKTTKMIPVMIVGFFLHKVRYPFRKVLVAMLITVGVTGFSFYSSIKTKRTTTAESSGGVGFDYGRGFGFLLLVGDLFFSAYTASTQDAVVQIMHYSSIPLMIWTNVFALFWQVAMMLISEFPAPLDALSLSQLAQLVRHYVPPQLTPALGLCLRSATLTHTIVVYTICGVAGQMIVFYILARFGSVTLTATTVTRKVFGIVLSIVWNRHDLHWLQWVSLGPILAGVGLDFTLHGQKKKAGIKSSEKKKDR